MKKFAKPEHSSDVLIGEKSVVSATECTGMIQALPESQEEKDAYSDIYNLPKNR